jgi:hypothetical protein
LNFIDKFKFRWDPVKFITSKLKEWKPKKYSTEKEYENSLYTFLHDEMGDLQVTKQYAKGRIRADIVIADKVIIELKHNLNTTAKYQRLIGQLNEYKDWEGQVIILLTGDPDRNLLKQLDAYIKKEGFGEDILGEAKFIVYQK